jgi:kynurenine formamidase
MALIDLSLTIAPNNSEPVAVRIDYISHKDGANMLGQSAGLTYKNFPDEIGLSLEIVTLTTHTGTHIDAPLHYGPTSEGVPSSDITQVPLDWFIGNGVIIRLNTSPELGDVTINECKEYLEKIEYQLKPFDIVLFQLEGDKYWGTPEYFTKFRGISKEVTEWLISFGIKVIGVDTFGFDAPFHKMLERYVTSNNPSTLWPSHVYGRKKSYCQIERLTNLANITVNYGFKVMCFPIKICNSGAGWSRVVAEI